MSTLQPEKPGDWTEAVLLAFTGSWVASEQYSGRPMVIVPVDVDMKIFFRENLTRPEPSYIAVLHDIYRSVVNTTLCDSTDIDILVAEVRDLLERYLEATVALSAPSLTIPEEWS